MKTPEEFAQLMSAKNPNLAKRPEGSFTISPPKEKQKLEGFEKFWVALPIAVVVAGGAIGGLIGGIGMVLNLKIFRSTESKTYKYATSTCVLIGTFIVWWITVLILTTIFPQLRRH